MAAAALTLFATGCGGARNKADVASSKLTATSKGVVSLDSSPAYRAPGTVTITVTDSDLNVDHGARDGAHVTIASTTSSKPMSVNLKETGVDTGVFTGSVQIVLVATKGALTVSNGDTITVTYQDANDGTGNAAVVTATARVDNTSPDLTMTAASGPASATAGDTISFTGTVANDNVGGSTSNWVVVSYLLRNVVSGSEVRIADVWAYPNLGPGQSAPANVSGVVPTNLPTGDYSIIAVADPYGYVAESSETNNVFAPAPTIHITGLPLADLTMTAAAGPSSATAGDTISFTGTVTNAPGGQPTYNWVVVSYLLKSVADGSEVRIADTWAYPNLGAGQSAPANVSGVIPTNLPTGDYYILAAADPYGYVAESNEGNNLFDPPSTIHITGLPLADLTMTAAAGPSSATAGDIVSFTGTVTNASGGQPTYNWVVVSYLLRSVADGSEVRIADTWAYPNLGAGQSAPANAGGVIPTNLPTGDYQIIAVADPYGYVAELSESNNVFDPPPTIHITGLPPSDLTMTAAAGPSSATAGETVTFTSTVTNASGDQPTYNWVVVSYLLRNVVDGSEVRIADVWAYPNLGPGQSAPANVSGVIPTNLPTGDYSIIAVADPYGYVAELSDSNNVFDPPPMIHVTGLPLADLTMTAAAGPSSASPGEIVSFTGTVTNASGGQPTYNWVVVSYLLKSVADGSEVRVADTWAVVNLGAGQSAPANASGVIPTNLPAGDYYIITVADPYGYVAESNEGNNVFDPPPTIHINTP